MNRETYELIAYAARYWFALLAILIVWRAWRACVRDNRAQKAMRSMQVASGCVGELVLIKDGGRRPKKNPQRFPVPAEAVLGSSRSADIRVRGEGIAKKHLYMAWRPGEMVVHPLNGAVCQAAKDKNGDMVVRDGGKLTVGNMQFTMEFFDVIGSGKKMAKTDAEDEFRGVWE